VEKIAVIVNCIESKKGTRIQVRKFTSDPEYLELSPKQAMTMAALLEMEAMRAIVRNENAKRNCD
jgi:formylmethanofuran dehydrogenase subunit E